MTAGLVLALRLIALYVVVSGQTIDTNVPNHDVSAWAGRHRESLTERYNPAGSIGKNGGPAFSGRLSANAFGSDGHRATATVRCLHDH